MLSPESLNRVSSHTALLRPLPVDPLPCLIQSELTVAKTWPYHGHMARTESIRVLVSPEEKLRIEKAALAARRSMSDWLRLLAEEAIDRAAEESTRKVPG